MRLRGREYPDEIKYTVEKGIIWNVRTNRFHRKCGYKQTGKDIESVYYEKRKKEDSCGYPLLRNVKIHIKW